MTDNVIPMRPRAPICSEQCECGSAWFAATVCVERQDGYLHVTGYQVPLKCIECGKEAS